MEDIRSKHQSHQNIVKILVWLKFVINSVDLSRIDPKEILSEIKHLLVTSYMGFPTLFLCPPIIHICRAFVIVNQRWHPSKAKQVVA